MAQSEIALQLINVVCHVEDKMHVKLKGILAINVILHKDFVVHVTVPIIIWKNSTW